MQIKKIGLLLCVNFVFIGQLRTSHEEKQPDRSVRQIIGGWLDSIKRALDDDVPAQSDAINLSVLAFQDPTAAPTRSISQRRLTQQEVPIHMTDQTMNITVPQSDDDEKTSKHSSPPKSPPKATTIAAIMQTQQTQPSSAQASPTRDAIVAAHMQAQQTQPSDAQNILRITLKKKTAHTPSQNQILLSAGQTTDTSKPEEPQSAATAAPASSEPAKSHKRKKTHDQRQQPMSHHPNDDSCAWPMQEKAPEINLHEWLLLEQPNQ